MIFFYFLKFIFDINHQNDLKISKKFENKIKFLQKCFSTGKKKRSLNLLLLTIFAEFYLKFLGA
jgi:hypothetical protein